MRYAPLLVVGLFGCAVDVDEDPPPEREDDVLPAETALPARAVAEVPAGGPESPFDAPPRCTLRPVRVEGKLVADDPRGEWCEYGACGRSGSATCRVAERRDVAKTVGDRCVTCRWRKLECGTTEGCLAHDACYDERFRENDQGSSALWLALRGYCDVPIAAIYPREEWVAWMSGRPGPSGFSRWLPYRELEACLETAGPCER